MEFRLLGDLEIRDQGGTLPLSDGKQKALLAVLLLNANQVVPVDALIDALWDGHASPKAGSNLRALVSRLRRTIGAERMERRGCGYVLHVGDDELDLARFEQLRTEAGRAGAEEASRKLRAALELWRGQPLAEFAYERWAQSEIRRLEELRLLTLEERIEADLASGRHGELVGELTALVAEHPLVETLRRLLILALYRAGRQAEALAAYQDARRMLDEELGLEPSTELRQLEGAILRHDPSLEPPAGRLRFAPARAAFSSRSRGLRTKIAIGIGAAVLGLGTAAAAVVVTADDRLQEKPAPAAAVAPRPASTSRTVAAPAGRPSRAPAQVKRVPRPSRPKSAAAPLESTSRPTTTRTLQGTSRPAMKTAGKSESPGTKTPAPVSRPVARFADDFDDDVTDGIFWQSGVTGTGVTVAEREGRLEVAFATDAAAGESGPMAGRYATTCRFLGDFDATVEFELLDWPSTNGVTVQLVAWFGSGSAAAVRESQTWSEGYSAFLGPWAPRVPAVDRHGALRLRRVGRNTLAYFQQDRAWSPLGGYPTDGAATLGLLALSKDEWFRNEPVRIAFDNFELEAEQPAC